MYRSLLALSAGVLNALAFEPFGWWPLALISLMLLFYLWLGQNSRPFRLGLCFGLGQFGVGISWTYVSIHTYGGMPPLIAAACIVLLVLYLSLYPALAGLLQQWFQPRRQALRLVFIMPAVWLGFEWLRGWLLTGLPWLTTGYALLDTPLGNAAPLGGVYAVSLIALMTAGAAVNLLLTSSARDVLFAGLVAAIWLLAWQARYWVWSTPVGEPIRVALVQNNVPLEYKWEARHRQQIIDDYVRVSRRYPDTDLIVWPEAAVPDYLDNLPPSFWHQLEQHPADFIFGLIYRQGPPDSRRYYNSLIAFGSQTSLYHKQHLVPFGEYFPLQWLLQPLIDLLTIPLSNLSAWPTGQPPLQAAGVRLAASICYEDAFPLEWQNQVPTAGLLINVSEDRWFGDSLAPHQRLQMARFRVRETERAMLRSANSGLSAVIDWNADVLHQAPQFARAVVTARVQPRTGVTPYVAYGDLPALLSALLIFFCAWLFGGGKLRYNHGRLIHKP